MYDPEGSDTDFEWLEIYNNGVNSVTIEGGSGQNSWRIVDGTSNRTLAETAYQGSMILETGEYTILAKNPTQFITRYPNYLGNLIQVAGLSLGNTSDTVALKIGTNGVFWSSVPYDSSWGGNEGRSLEKIEVNGINDQTNWISSKKVHGSPGNPYIPNIPPQAILKFPAEAFSGQEVEFNASNSVDIDGQIVSYFFDFGDGNDETSENEIVIHEYDITGNYQVILTVTDDCGDSNSVSQTIYVRKITYSHQVRLNEILPSPGIEIDWDGSGKADYRDEWVELFNSGWEKIDLSNWKIDDEKGGSSAFQIPNNTFIKSGQYLIFYRQQTGLALNNDNDSVCLFSPDGELQEEFSYDSVGIDEVYAKDYGGKWQLSITPTPGIVNTINNEDDNNEDKHYSQEIILSEFLPYPGQQKDWDGSGGADFEDEWIEIYNEGKEAIDLSTWLLDDEEGGSKPFVIPSNTIIKSGQYLIFYRQQTCLALNNNGDELRLFHPNGELIEEFSFEKIGVDEVYAKNEKSSWQLSVTPTPGEKNLIQDSEDEDNSDETGGDESGTEEIKEFTIAQARELSLGSEIVITGILVATPEILGTKIIYLVDETGGLKIKLTDGDYSTLTLGDKIKISGILQESYQERYLNMQSDSFLQVLTHESFLNPRKVTIDEVGELLEGQFVYVNAKIISTSGNTFYLDDGTGQIKIYIKESSGIDKPRMRVGYYALIIGIVSQYKDEYRILPRYQEDIIVSPDPIDEGKVLGLTGLPKTGRRNYLWGLLLIIIGGRLKIERRWGKAY